jgi:capsular polysaccharide biosynthesis protein
MAERYPRFMLPSPYLSKPAIADLLRRTMGQRRLIPQTGAVKVVDPFLAHDLMSDDSICWLRANSHLHVGRGDRRVYIRRSAQTARSVRSGGISETAAFRRFLADYGFEILEFGDGELTAQEQVMKLDGCSIIISAHGAALTNLVYLDPPTTVIEIFGPYTSRPMYMHICATLGLNYYGVVSFECDAANDIIVDCTRCAM